MTKRKVAGIVSLLLALTVVVSLFVACDKEVVGEQALTNLPETTDNYRTLYQIFPYSFADSDGNGIGDIQGIIDKLDYIADMNFDGIWLTPVHQSSTYHKYDVIDYYSIDSQFGTLDDYDRLVTECHKRGMTIIMDLVINHTSSRHQWFETCVAMHARGRSDNQYYNYYNLIEGTTPSGVWYQSKAPGWLYEGQFWDQMPDLNWQEVLDNPDGYLANDLKEIMRFWLIDHNVDGFRLDAVSQFFTGNQTKNIEALAWINETAKSIKSDCYIVGEGPWDSTAYNYYESGADSFFLFNHGYQGGGTISMAARVGDVNRFISIDSDDKERIGNDQIPALFVANHDTNRAYTILAGDVSVNNMKFGYGLMAMCDGATFWYYGDEVGMNNVGELDENKRQPMPWGDSYTCKPVIGSTSVSDSVKYPLGTVASNLKDANSLVNYITRANALRRSFPQIARNYGEVVYKSNEKFVALVKKGSGDDAVYIAINVSPKFDMKLDLTGYGNFEVGGTLSVEVTKTPQLKGSVLSLPPMSIVVLQKV